VRGSPKDKVKVDYMTRQRNVRKEEVENFGAGAKRPSRKKGKRATTTQTDREQTKAETGRKKLWYSS